MHTLIETFFHVILVTFTVEFIAQFPEQVNGSIA